MRQRGFLRFLQVAEQATGRGDRERQVSAPKPERSRVPKNRANSRRALVSSKCQGGRWRRPFKLATACGQVTSSLTSVSAGASGGVPADPGRLPRCRPPARGRAVRAAVHRGHPGVRRPRVRRARGRPSGPRPPKRRARARGRPRLGAGGHPRRPRPGPLRVGVGAGVARHLLGRAALRRGRRVGAGRRRRPPAGVSGRRRGLARLSHRHRRPHQRPTSSSRPATAGRATTTGRRSTRRSRSSGSSWPAGARSARATGGSRPSWST